MVKFVKNIMSGLLLVMVAITRLINMSENGLLYSIIIGALQSGVHQNKDSIKLELWDRL